MTVDLSIIGFHNLYEIYIHTDTYVLYVQYRVTTTEVIMGTSYITNRLP